VVDLFVIGAHDVCHKKHKEVKKMTIDGSFMAGKSEAAGKAAKAAKPKVKGNPEEFAKILNEAKVSKNSGSGLAEDSHENLLDLENVVDSNDGGGTTVQSRLEKSNTYRHFLVTNYSKEELTTPANKRRNEHGGQLFESGNAGGASLSGSIDGNGDVRAGRKGRIENQYEPKAIKDWPGKKAEGAQNKDS